MAAPGSTVKQPFDAESQASILRKAMAGLGTNEKQIIEVVGDASNAQRQMIHDAYSKLYTRDLINDFKKELSGDFLKLVLSLMMKPPYFDATYVHKAISGVGTNESLINEILTTRKNKEIHEIGAAYKDAHGKDLESAIRDDTSGDYRNFLLTLAKGTREAEAAVDVARAKQDAAALKRAGVDKLGTDENKFIEIFTSRSFGQLRATFDEYKQVAGQEIVASIRSEFSSDIRDGLLVMVDVARDTPNYFAKRLSEAMKGVGTNEDELILVIVSRSEVDLDAIEKSYSTNYGRTLATDIEKETSGDFRQMLLKMLNRKFP